MASHTLSFLLAILLLACLFHVAQANYQDDVNAAGTILRDLPQTLAIPFCSEYDRAPKPTAAATVTAATESISTGTFYQVTAGSTVRTLTGDDVFTITRTTTITYITTSTITVTPTSPPPAKRSISAPKFLRDVFPDDFFPYQRATWCPDFDVPCRLVQYNRYVIAAACMKYLDDDSTQSVAAVTQEAAATETGGGGNGDDEPVRDPSIPYGDEFIAPQGLPMTCLPWDSECKAKLQGGGEVSPEVQQAQWDYEYGN